MSSAIGAERKATVARLLGAKGLLLPDADASEVRVDEMSEMSTPAAEKCGSVGWSVSQKLNSALYAGAASHPLCHTKHSLSLCSSLSCMMHWALLLCICTRLEKIVFDPSIAEEDERWDGLDEGSDAEFSEALEA